MKIGSVNNITIIMIIFLLSTIMLLYIFEFGLVHAQNYDQDNNNNNEINDDLDYIFDPGNYVDFEEEEEEKKEKVVVRNDKSDNENNLVKSSSTTSVLEKKEIERSNNINTVNKKNSESKLNIIDENNNKNNDDEYVDYVNEGNNDNPEQENYNLDDKVVVKTRLNLQNLEKRGVLNIAAFINGQKVLKNVSLDKIEPTKKTLTVNLPVDKETDIVQAGSRDEFFVCAYHVKNSYKNEINNNALTYFDCDEGDLAGPDETTISRLFSTSSQVYRESQNIFANSSSKYSQLITANKNINNNNINKNSLEENEKRNAEKDIVKIKIYAPLEDRKDIEKIKIIAMVKGQIKSAVIDNVQEEFEKIGGYKVSRTFTFDRDTNLGKIQIGDKFFTCVSGTDLNPPEGTECEKRTIKYIGKKENVLYAR